MTYWQILKQRRKALKLTIEDVSYQTRLAPEQIEAIENNRLSEFQNQIGYVTYYVQNYCNAIGVNWYAIEEDVNANVQSYIRRKNLQSSVRPVVPANRSQARPAKASTAASGTRKAAPKKAGTKKGSAGRKNGRRTTGSAAKRNSAASQTVKKNTVNARKRARAAKLRKKRLTRLAALTGLLVLLGLVGLNFWMERRDAAVQSAQEAQRQEELKRKEEETAKLAEQKKNGVTSSADDVLVIEPVEGQDNVFTIEDTSKKVKSLKFDVQLPDDSTVCIYKDGSLLSNDPDAVYSDEFSATVSIDSACTITLEIGTYAGGNITINSQKVTFDDSSWSQGDGAVLIFHVVESQDDTSQDTDEDTDQDVTSDETEYDGNYDDGTEYGSDEDAEEENVFTGNYDYSNTNG